MLVVGVVGDAEILRNKGPPVYTEEERCVFEIGALCASALTRLAATRSLIMVDSVKWVDEVLKDVPYDVSESFMQTLFEARRARATAVPRSRSTRAPLSRAEAQD